MRMRRQGFSPGVTPGRGHRNSGPHVRSISGGASLDACHLRELRCSAPLCCIGHRRCTLTVTFPIDPVEAPKTSEEFRISIKNLMESYHDANVDLLLEILQNSVDAIENKFGSTATTLDKPIIKIHVEFTSGTVSIFDTVPGIPDAKIQRLASPANTDKNAKRRRDHKGVGLGDTAQLIAAVRGTFPGTPSEAPLETASRTSTPSGSRRRAPVHPRVVGRSRRTRILPLQGIAQTCSGPSVA